jgi:hypothetical protein
MRTLARFVASWLRHYTTSQKVTASRPDKVNDILSIYLIFPATLVSGAYSASDKWVPQAGKLYLRVVESGQRLSLVTWALSEVEYLNIMGYSTSQYPIGLHGLLQG